MKNKQYIPKRFVFLDEYDKEKCNAWMDEHNWELWGEYFRVVRYWKNRTNQDNIVYALLVFRDIQIQVGFIVKEMPVCFASAMKYFIKVEDYEMCQYIKELAKELNIEIKLQ